MSEFLEFVKDTLNKYLINFDEKKISEFYPYFFWNLNCFIDDIKVFFTEICIILDSLDYWKKQIKEKCIENIISKSHDYSDSIDRYSSFKRTINFVSVHVKIVNLDYVESSAEAIFYFNMCQKISRLENLLVNKIDEKNEKIEDSLIDLINYRLLFEGYKMGLQ